MLAALPLDRALFAGLTEPPDSDPASAMVARLGLPVTIAREVVISRAHPQSLPLRAKEEPVGESQTGRSLGFRGGTVSPIVFAASRWE